MIIIKFNLIYNIKKLVYTLPINKNIVEITTLVSNL